VSFHQGGNGNCPSRVLQRSVVLGFVEKYVAKAMTMNETSTKDGGGGGAAANGSEDSGDERASTANTDDKKEDLQ
jgi:hypothetical protein